MATLPVKSPAPWAQWASSALVVVPVAAALAVSFAPCFVNLVGLWNADPNNSYGYLVIPMAAYILWDRRHLLNPARLAPCWWGFLPLVALLVLRVFLYERNEQYIEASLIPWVVGSLVLTLGGWHLLRVALPAVVFLGFMMPVPPSFNGLLATPLQTLATRGTLILMQVTNLPVIAQGNVIFVGANPLEVARACNGLSMLVSFVALNALVVLVSRRPIWERILIMASAIPIALVSNIIRITATGWSYYLWGRAFGDKVAHDAAGFAMLGIALVLLQVELWVLSWLFYEVEEVRPVAPRRRAAVKDRAEKA
ncbi:MAG: exosortase/archaeosortase family protein [Isosphaeraceae bacterium]|nr:exosortase/archaeosortase family protein [Isosphaeraceae bacterium]